MGFTQTPTQSSPSPGLPQSTTITAGSPSSAGPFYIDMTALLNGDVIADWTGTIAGTFKVESGADFDGPNRIGTRPGRWVDVTATAVPAIKNPTGSADNTEISCPFWTAPWARVSLTGITGSGVITFTLTGKP